MPTIAAFTCIKNGIDFIEAWYENVQPADHIIIQDGGSTDGTRELLFKWANENPKVTLLLQKEPWEKYKWDEQRVRNQCLSLYHNFGPNDLDWILYTDCDELISDEFWNWFRNTDHRKEDKELIAYYLPHRNLWMTRDMFRMDAPWYPDYTVRLFKNHRGLVWIGAEHASLWRMTGMINKGDSDVDAVPEDVYLVHYHRAYKEYRNQVMEDKIDHHSNEKNNVLQRGILTRLRKHPTGAGLIKWGLLIAKGESNETK